MHPLINFADAINKTLKSFQDISTQAKTTYIGGSIYLCSVRRRQQDMCSQIALVKITMLQIINKKYGEFGELVLFFPLIHILSLYAFFLTWQLHLVCLT